MENNLCRRWRWEFIHNYSITAVDNHRWTSQDFDNIFQAIEWKQKSTTESLYPLRWQMDGGYCFHVSKSAFVMHVFITDEWMQCAVAFTHCVQKHFVSDCHFGRLRVSDMVSRACFFLSSFVHFPLQCFACDCIANARVIKNNRRIDAANALCCLQSIQIRVAGVFDVCGVWSTFNDFIQSSFSAHALSSFFVNAVCMFDATRSKCSLH